MNPTNRIHQAILASSKKILTQANLLAKELGGAKNYVCTTDLKHWTYGKSVVLINNDTINGARARTKLQEIGFVDILKEDNIKTKKLVIGAFKTWASKVKDYPIQEKFEDDQKDSKRFMLLVHQSVLAKLSKASISVKGKKKQESFDEGLRKEVIRELSYRNPKVVLQAKETHGVTCKVCEFNFGETYGEHGEGFIEMHHLKPISLGKRKTTAEDLRPVCANCHRMLHRGDRMLSVEELKRIIAKKKRTITVSTN